MQPTAQQEPRRIPLPWLLTPFVITVVIGYVSDILGPKLIVDHPLLQMVMNPRNRYLLLASPRVEAVPFFVYGFFRLVLTDPIGFLLGWQYGDAAIAWSERKMGDETGVIRKVEHWFGKAAPVVIFIAPSFYWCVLAGAARMRPRQFIVLNVAGTIARLVLFRMAGAAFRDELEHVLDWIQRYQWWLVGLSAILVAFQVLRGGDRGMLESPLELAEEIEAEEESLRDD